MLPRIHCITDLPSYPDPPSCTARTLDTLAAVVGEGVDAIQVRAKQFNARELYVFTRSVVDRLSGTAARVIVNDRLDIALAAGAHGVHLGRGDLPVGEARRLAPDGFLIGGTCRNAAHARQAKAEGADYIGVGPVYPSLTKTGLPEPVGEQNLREAAQVLPAIAISGITAHRVPEVMAAGAHGVAVIAAIWGADHPGHAAREIVDAALCR